MKAAVKSEFEIIRYNSNLPAKIEIKQGSFSIGMHWHKEIELLYVLEGEMQLITGSKSLTLKADGVFVINSSENHSLRAENTKCLILDISYEFAQRFDSYQESIYFEIVQGSGAEEELGNLMWQVARPAGNHELPALKQYSLLTEILHVMFVQCRRKKQEALADNAQINPRHIRLASEYVKQHFQEEFSENEIAKMLGLHPIYFCTLFKQSMGLPFREYVLKIRLEHSMDALLNKHMTVEDAATAGEFPSKRTFIAKCKRAYNITPFQLLKQRRESGGEK